MSFSSEERSWARSCPAARRLLDLGWVAEVSAGAATLTVWLAVKFAVEPSAKVTTTDPSAWTWTSVAVGFTPLTASTTFAFSSSVKTEESATTVNEGSWTPSASLAVFAEVASELVGCSATTGEVVDTSTAGALYVPTSSLELASAAELAVLVSTSPVSAVSALTVGATKAAPTAKTSEQPNKKCFPFLIIRQFFCSAFLRLKYITLSPFFKNNCMSFTYNSIIHLF